MKDVGLVLEGGGMRGVYTGGILEFFLEKGLHFPYVIAVSAGACNAASYISKQNGRNKAVTVDYAGHPNYLSFKRFFTNGELFNMDFIFDEIPNKNNVFDYKTFFDSNQTFYIGTTDCKTGETIYYEKNEVNDEINKVLRASSSLPMIAPIIEYEGRSLLDGGISDPIPINKSIKDGNEKHVVILTQCEGYVKKPLKRGKWVYRRRYAEYGGLLDIIEKRSNIYNAQIQRVLELEKEGKALVFRPDNLMKVTRMEKKRDRLNNLYLHGYNQAKSRFDEIKDFLEVEMEKSSLTNG
ncbi:MULTISPECIES: patatin-like phospholipase family protein [Bacillaceae]|uniref:Patatin family protein n=1 Tax=Evansella alkalicola TaxID=745819 RepID=A0ABS6JY05_9BACI|nr:patatin family protein [Litchfieldia alkalitelluris]MBU9722097.1 patatin family protein [Bacillus alkalicola]